MRLLAVLLVAAACAALELDVLHSLDGGISFTPVGVLEGKTKVGVEAFYKGQGITRSLAPRRTWSSRSAEN
jgi:hypothetical protein